MNKYRNYYKCSECGTMWQDDWDSMCNDRCPECNAEIEPYHSGELNTDGEEIDPRWNINPKKIEDYKEKTWFLGTDVLLDSPTGYETSDFNLMSEKKGVVMQCDECAMYHTRRDDLRQLGYSEYFCSIIKEAKERGYIWVVFDRDIVTTIREEQPSKQEDEIKVGDSVYVYQSKDANCLYNHDFTGTVKSIKEAFVSVEDQDGDVYVVPLCDIGKEV